MIPSHLYHYTSVEALLLILENNTFRFNRLDKMNDPLDGHSDLYSESRQNVFSSSWTAEKRDELPMWKIYSDLKGVRIKMPIDLFNFTDNLTVAKLNKGNNYLIKSQLNKSYQIERKELLYEHNKNFKRKLPTNSVYGPTKIDYYSKKSDLTKGLIKERKDVDFPFYEINLNLIGQKKIDYWNFEKEYRFRMFYGNSIMLAGSTKVLKEMFDKSPITTNFIDVEFKQEALENIEIILGPESDGNTNKKIEEVLKTKNISKFKIRKSRIKIK
ncbi:hypothetical protein [Olleya namhaensis]|uniref:hypothetical protein n=1 Tax=Olleya namhaensis TaxID=1144750 RepID=UPI0023311528|nr:hypothetical protein [Olleya namhaensis]